ncbi:hypothetical protein B0E46_15735 [Rhodanobacter sp. B04]|uniref:hypothetical protein n=1 Tax=Rhodanobacter sp. B04 TaxID=1945860 RepID=UPI0009874458|nr:hypothetical protein [Rhodanobacter sp. B04]OOG61428.1 hypothetical protein B0E46_15735 [Rhodanobacter sp. B04]
MIRRVQGNQCDYGIVFWIRFAEWCAARPKLLDAISMVEGTQHIRDNFNVSRATAYRWLAAWREVHPTIPGDRP